MNRQIVFSIACAVPLAHAADVSVVKSQYLQAMANEHPNAELLVNYVQGDERDADGRYPSAWYRETYIFGSDQTLHRLEKLDNDLTTTNRLIIETNTQRRQQDGVAYSYSSQIESRLGDESPYFCEVVLGVSTEKNGIEYGLDNRISFAQPQASAQRCKLNNLANAINERYLFVTDNREADTQYSAQFYITRPDDGFKLLPEVLDTWAANYQLDANTLINAMSSLPSSFNDVGIDQAAWWVKSKRFNDNGNEVYQTIDNNGQQQRFTTTPDGSNFVECSADGDTWSAC